MKRIATLGLHHDHVWSNLHQLQETGGAELVAAADEDEALLDKYRSELPGKTYASYEALLDEEDLDAVYLFGSNRLNEDLTVMACKRGLHCLVEKPMASTLAGAERMLAAATGAGVRLMINWPFAWWPQLRHGIAMAQAGEIGQLWQVKYRAAHQGPVELGCSAQFCEWLYDTELNGAGALMDYCCYGAVLADVLLGKPDSVSGTIISTGLKPDLQLEDNAILVLSYPHALATTEASWTQIGSLTSYGTTLYGSKGTLVIEPDHEGKIILATAEHPAGRILEIPPQPDHLDNSATHFLAAINDPGIEIHPLCDARHGLGAQWILEEGIQSTR
ncbi:MAG: Gfo/Idh/MocA family oxidoreductase [Verrucomicrobiales bacterium]|nr:Gfo/Idh/MocA family oxidoreductase [Verrucomicrobiales bacterium]